ncbi:MAG: type IA DNA topoisomerase [Lachnospiraceae bacterium]|nr:type IA DNA topoisomerase [Lachnospiraceae bacterium]
MAKSIYIAEKPSVAREFAKALKITGKNHDGYIENDENIVTWCVGHLVTMSYPEAYDDNLKKWSLTTLPFLPKEWKYEVIDAVKKQFNVVKNLLNREDVDTIYVCTDSGREGEYIYRLVEQMSGVKGKIRKRVWIDSQTEEEILKGIKNAKDLSEYDNLSNAAYLRAKEDYLMGINFSRVLTLKYGNSVSNMLHQDRAVLSVGRVMTCVLGMVVRREREIRAFVEMPFYRVNANVKCSEKFDFDAEWKVNEKSKYFNSPYLYKDNGFRKEEYAKELINLINTSGNTFTVENIEKKVEKKNPPLLFNLAELQNECSKLFKISPDETLKIVQDLYEKKCVTYPRTDARVLSTAVAKEITKNIKGLSNFIPLKEFSDEIIEKEMYKGIEKTRYVDDKQITDHYAIIPTGQGLANINNLNPIYAKVYEVIARRFIAIFYPPARYQKISIKGTMPIKEVNEEYTETFQASFKVLFDEGYLKVMEYSFVSKKDANNSSDTNNTGEGNSGESNTNDKVLSDEAIKALKNLKKDDKLTCNDLYIKEGKTTPPKRYNSGSIILAMESAGQLIEDEELRAQIKGSGIGTSATRAEILKKLINIKYIALNKKTQIITPTQYGEAVFEVVDLSINHLLNPELTASWEKGLTYVSEGKITPDEYMEKLEGFVSRRTMGVINSNRQYELRKKIEEVAIYYKK